jgi:hypothetical protein
MRNIFLESLYNILEEVKKKSIREKYFKLSDNIPSEFNQSGLYFFFDKNIKRSSGGYKIVRIGKTGKNKNNRLKKHKSGNSSSSVFRAHIEKALKNKNNKHPNQKEIDHYIYKLFYLFIPIEKENDLKSIEKSCIEITSNKNQIELIDIPNKNWLGFQNGIKINKAISQSHLWCVHFTGTYNSKNEKLYLNNLKKLEKYVLKNKMN